MEAEVVLEPRMDCEKCGKESAIAGFCDGKRLCNECEDAWVTYQDAMEGKVVDDDIWEKIDDFRRKHKISSCKFARLVGVSESRIAHSGRRRMVMGRRVKAKVEEFLAIHSDKNEVELLSLPDIKPQAASAGMDEPLRKAVQDFCRENSMSPSKVGEAAGVSCTTICKGLRKGFPVDSEASAKIRRLVSEVQAAGECDS